MMQDVRKIMGQHLWFKSFGHQDLGVIPSKGKTYAMLAYEKCKHHQLL